jgi:hypothetical protein
MSPSAADIIHRLDLKPHPEGGHFRETFRDTKLIDGRAVSTAIYFLLLKEERSHWHRVDAVARSGTFMPARRWRSRLRMDRKLRSSGSVAIWQLANSHRQLCRRILGRQRNRSATGRYAAARSRRVLNFPASSWRRKAGRQQSQRDAICRCFTSPIGRGRIAKRSG